MKRIIAFMLCFCMLFGLAACKNNDEEEISIITEYEYVTGDGNKTDADKNTPTVCNVTGT